MLTIMRVNPKGQSFRITEVFSVAIPLTSIEHNGDRIMVHAHIWDISQAWFNWQMNCQLIQQAFPFLSTDEREFLQTGLTKEKWEAIFSGGEHA